MKWPEVIQSIAKQYGTIYTEQEVLGVTMEVEKHVIKE